MKKRKISKEEKKWVKTLIIGGLGWMFIVKPLTGFLDNSLPDGALRLILGFSIIAGILWLWDI